MTECDFCGIDLEKYRIGREGRKGQRPDWIRNMESHFWPDTTIKCGRLVADRKSWFAVLDARPLKKGHTLVILKTHRDDIADASLEDTAAMTEGLTVCARATLEELGQDGVEKVYVCSLCDGVTHLHFHLVSRFKGDKTGFGMLGDAETHANDWVRNIGASLYPSLAQDMETLAVRLRRAAKRVLSGQSGRSEDRR